MRLGNWKGQDDPVPKDYREGLANFIGCPACFGFWISVAWYLSWAFFGYQTLVAASVMAISALLIFQRSVLDPPED